LRKGRTPPILARLVGTGHPKETIGTVKSYKFRVYYYLCTIKRNKNRKTIPIVKSDF